MGKTTVESQFQWRPIGIPGLMLAAFKIAWLVIFFGIPAMILVMGGTVGLVALFFDFMSAVIWEVPLWLQLGLLMSSFTFFIVYVSPGTLGSADAMLPRVWNAPTVRRTMSAYFWLRRQVADVHTLEQPVKGRQAVGSAGPPDR